MMIKNAAFIKRPFLIGLSFLILFLFQTNLSYAGATSNREYEHVVAHGGGACFGFETTNSVEAVNQAIQNGYQWIELDLDISADKKVIMIHDWDRTASYYYGESFDKKLTLSQFLNLSVHGKFEVLTFDKLVSVLDQHPQITIITDTKGNNLDLLGLIAKQYPDYLDRLIPQIYLPEELEAVRDLGYQDVILTLYKLPEVNADELSEYVLKNHILAVTMPDYMADRKLCRQLSDRNVAVYVHPVGTMEDALRFLEEGAVGIYSGTILPEELEGFEKEYYLTAETGKTAVKLTDQTLHSLNELKLHGLKPGETAELYVDDILLPFNRRGEEDITAGKHQLTVRVNSAKGLKNGELEYLIWRDADGIRVLHKKLGYRIDEIQEEKDFSTVMETLNIPQDIVSILKHSFVAAKGSDHYYNNGESGKYKNEKEILLPRTTFSGKLLLPLSTTAVELGTASVTMDKGRDIVITKGKEKIRACIGSYMIRSGFRVTKIKTPIELYLNKAMADGEIYKYLTGREYLEDGETIVILPDGVQLDRSRRNEILKSARSLFEDEAVEAGSQMR